MIEILIPRAWTPRAILDSFRTLGRSHANPRQTPISWMDDRLEQRFGGLMLCQPCEWRRITELTRRHYRRDPEHVAMSRCDNCGNEDRALHIFYPEEKFSVVRSTAEERNAERRRGALVVTPGGLTCRS